VSINDLVKEEANRQVDTAIEDIPADRKKYGSPLGKTILQYKDLSDFLLGYEFGYIIGYIIGVCMLYYNNQVKQSGREGITEEEDRQVTRDIETVIVDRLPEIRQVISRTS
jgi:hypothetical protein